MIEVLTGGFHVAELTLAAIFTPICQPGSEGTSGGATGIGPRRFLPAGLGQEERTRRSSWVWHLRVSWGGDRIVWVLSVASRPRRGRDGPEWIPQVSSVQGTSRAEWLQGRLTLRPSDATPGR
jgi:hypothetical protein